jgi:long-chain fatty acid transport protein
MGKYVRLTYVSAAALICGLGISGHAQAGGYAVREQSTQFMGTSFAGDAAGGDLSSMFWNPAAAASANGINFSSNYTLLLPDSHVTATGGDFLAERYSPNSGGYSIDAIVPASYANYQLSDRWFLGLALNSPFGFTTGPSNTWAGSPIENTSKIFTLDINPTLAYKVTPQITVGAGVQIEYFKISESSGAGSLGPLAWTGRTSSLDDWGVGATAGVIWQPSALTSLGLGYRGQVEVNPSGDCSGRGLTNIQAGNPSGCYVNGNGVAVHSSVTLPDSLTLSGRQQVTPQLALLGTIEWTDWSLIHPVSAYNSAGTAVDALHVGFDDGWFFAIGAEYAYSPRLTLRTGLSYEVSPVTDANRTQFLPDANRWTPSVGASYKWSDRITVDLAYSHIFFNDAHFTETATVAPFVTFTLLDAVAKTDVDVVSLGLKYKFAGAAALEPYK